MKMSGKSTRRELSMITVGFSPARDITCCGRNLDWGLHKYIDEQTIRPAGKARKRLKGPCVDGAKKSRRRPVGTKRLSADADSGALFVAFDCG